ncbi:20635_t:CDS:2, partial [Entrophospora sp. SA101]
EDWDQLEILWRHLLLKELKVKRSRNECPVLLSIPDSWNKECLEKIAHIFFESFNVPGLYITSNALMSLYGCNSITGLVIDIGYGTT